MSPVLNLIQSTEIEGRNGLLESFLQQLQQSIYQQVFISIQVIVPNHAYVNYLKNIVAKRFAVYANIDFVVLPGPVLQNLFSDNNPNTQFIDFNLARFVIYDYLCKHTIDSSDALELNQYIYTNGKLDINKIFALSTELGKIFQEYIYLRTEELLNPNSIIYSTWQGGILKALLHQDKKSFLDIYKFFMQTNLDNLKLPEQIFIFGLTSIYPAQLKLLKQIGNKCKIYWYYHSSSYEYYGDLLSDKTKSKLQQKLLASPNLSLDDLYLDDGNRIISNLGQQSREFIELLYANDINIINLNETYVEDKNSILAIMQQDIKTLKYRIKPELRLSNNFNFYQDPLDLAQHFTPDNKIFDLNNCLTSIKINSCHNSMREVQVMYNEITNILNFDSNCSLDRILICAPQIENYVEFIEAVFDNEYIVNQEKNVIKLPYNVTGVQQNKDFKLIELILLWLKAPSALNANYLIEILVNATYQNNMDMSQDNIELIKKWIYDNNIFFGYDAKDYDIFGYTNYSAHSFDQLIKNLTLGLFIPEDVFGANDVLPLVQNATAAKFCPYDNIEGNQIDLANKLIQTINLLKTIKQFFYDNQGTLKLCAISDIANLLGYINDNYIKIEEDKLVLVKLIKHLQSIVVDVEINLDILIIIITEFIDSYKSKVNFKGTITCTSLKNIRNIPFDYIYVLGLNFGEFPQSVKQKYLSMLNNNWHIGDINYNIEDKQSFLDLFLSTQKGIFFSYHGKNEVDNTDLNPSPILNLIMSTLSQSFINFMPTNKQQYNLYNLFEQHALHPFYNNSATNFSKLWHDVAQNTELEFKNLRWNFEQSHLNLSKETINELLSINLNELSYTFLFTNSTIYKALNIKNYPDLAQIQDYEANTFYNRDLANKIATIFEKYASFYQHSKETLCEFLIANGLLEYNHWGQSQFNLYVMLFDKYLLQRGANLCEFNFTYKLEQNNNSYIITIKDKFRFEDNKIILINDFKYIYSNKDKVSPNINLKIKAIILKLLLQHGLVTPQPIKEVVIKSFSMTSSIDEYVVPDLPDALLNEFLVFYLNSINTPVLVHKKAIEKYLEAKASKKMKTPEEIYSEVRNVYEGDYNNTGLEQLNTDIVFAEVADEYFDFVAEHKMQNDIFVIAKMLECTNLIG